MCGLFRLLGKGHNNGEYIWNQYLLNLQIDNIETNQSFK